MPVFQSVQHVSNSLEIFPIFSFFNDFFFLSRDGFRQSQAESLVNPKKQSSDIHDKIRPQFLVNTIHSFPTHTKEHRNHSTARVSGHKLFNNHPPPPSPRAPLPPPPPPPPGLPSQQLSRGNHFSRLADDSRLVQIRRRVLKAALRMLCAYYDAPAALRV